MLWSLVVLDRLGSCGWFWMVEAGFEWFLVLGCTFVHVVGDRENTCQQKGCPCKTANELCLNACTCKGSKTK